MDIIGNHLAREIIEIQPTLGFQTEKLRVAAYARVSSDSEDQLSSFATQVSHYTKFISENQDWNLVEVFADEGISGVSMDKREEFIRMLEQCRDGKIDRIITKSSSRFARNITECITTLRELKGLGISVFFEKEGIDTGKISGENLITLYAVFAQEESMNISKNCKKGIRMRMEKGTYTTPNAPYGYRLLNKELVVELEEAKVVQQIFREYLSGSGVWTIAQSLNAQKIPWTKSDKGWHRNTIAVILKNHSYKGAFLWQKSFAEDVLPYKRHNKGQLPQFYVENSLEPVISPFQFELANVLLEERKKNINTQYEVYPYTKKIHCKDCGSVYIRRVSRGTHYWSCRVHTTEAQACDSKRIPEQSIHKAFVTLYNKLRGNYQEILIPLRNQLERLQEIGERGNEELRDLNKKIAEYAEQNHTMSALVTAGILDSALFIAQSDALKKRMEKAKYEKKRLLRKMKRDDKLEKTEEIIGFLSFSPEMMTEFDPETFEELVDKIIAYDKNTIDFVLINGLTLTERL